MLNFHHNFIVLPISHCQTFVAILLLIYCDYNRRFPRNFHGTGLIVLSLVYVPLFQKGTRNLVPWKKGEYGEYRGILWDFPGNTKLRSAIQYPYSSIIQYRFKMLRLRVFCWYLVFADWREVRRSPSTWHKMKGFNILQL